MNIKKHHPAKKSLLLFQGPCRGDSLSRPKHSPPSRTLVRIHAPRSVREREFARREQVSPHCNGGRFRGGLNSHGLLGTTSGQRAMSTRLYARCRTCVRASDLLCRRSVSTRPTRSAGSPSPMPRGGGRGVGLKIPLWQKNLCALCALCVQNFLHPRRIQKPSNTAPSSPSTAKKLGETWGLLGASTRAPRGDNSAGSIRAALDRRLVNRLYLR